MEAAENLREMLAFHDRYTPFRASDVAYGCRVTATDLAAQKITVVLAVLHARQLEQDASIAGSFGLVPSHSAS